jgi:hypothetical protein
MMGHERKWYKPLEPVVVLMFCSEKSKRMSWGARGRERATRRAYSGLDSDVVEDGLLEPGDQEVGALASGLQPYVHIGVSAYKTLAKGEGDTKLHLSSASSTSVFLPSQFLFPRGHISIGERHVQHL